MTKGIATKRIINGFSTMMFPWNANNKIKVSRRAIMDTGLNFGKNSFLNHSSPLRLISTLWVMYPANRGTTTNTTILATKVS